MNSDQQNHENELLEALLKEQNRPNREQEIQAIEAALTAQPKLTQKPISKPQWPWAVGIAASITVAITYFYHRDSDKDTLAILETRYTSEVPKYNENPPFIKDSKEDVIPKKTVKTTIERKPSAPSNSGSKVVASESESGFKIPVPEFSAPAPTTDYGDGADFGQGWGGQDGKGFIAGGEGGGYRDEGRLTGQKVLPEKRKTIPVDPTHPGDRFGSLIDPSWKNPLENALSTFSVDVDNASYSNVRRMIREGRSIPPDAVRIEEFINAFDYAYTPPTNDDAFAVHQSIATCPWNENNAILRIGIKGREIQEQQRPASNLVFLIDVSGSMQTEDKLPLVKESLKLLLGKLDERDSVSYVVYAGSEGVALPPTTLDENGRAKALNALNNLESGGSTNGGAGIKRAYDLAAQQFRKGGVNRVILCSDGDFNVGVTNTTQLVSLVKERAAANIYLSVLSFGTGNLNEEMLESIARDGNGNHYYIDSISEARRVFLQKLTGTLITIAKDVKLQLEFNPARVKSYRLIGYANRVLRNEDFANDRVDAGDIGAGHEVTAFYEIVPAGSPAPEQAPVLKYQPTEKEETTQTPAPAKIEDEWLTLKLRHKHPEGDKSSLQEHILRGETSAFTETDNDFRFAASIAMFGMKLRNDANVENINWQKIRTIATESLGQNPDETQTEFIDLLRKIEQ